jgi:hypothetical protein
MNRVPQPSNAGGNDQDKDMKTPQYDLNDFTFLLPDANNNNYNTSNINDNNIVTNSIRTDNNNNMTQISGLISSSPLDSNLPISAVPES